MDRRGFLGGIGATLGAAAALSAAAPAAATAASAANGATLPAPCDWKAFRALFPLDPQLVHLASFLFASHPRPVAEAIEHHRRGFDANPAEYMQARELTEDAKVRAAAAGYMGGSAGEIALTDSTTMGLALVYGGLKLAPGEEVLGTVHDHYSTEVSLQNRAARDGAVVRRIALYEQASAASVDQVVGRLRAAVKPNTRAIAITWVHSSTGVKLPVAAVSAMVAELNRERAPAERILLCVDGVHGFGVESEGVEELGCDFFMAGTHKWIFGPRGTGVVWGRRDAWPRIAPAIPSFGLNYGVWLGLLPAAQVVPGDLMTPGGFHSYEHRWALPQAFALHLHHGKRAVTQRIHGLNTLVKEGLAGMPHVRLHTPMAPGLSAGLVCFEVDGVPPPQVAKRLRAQGIVASTTPYRTSYARLAPSLLNDEAELERTLAVIGAMA